MRGFYDKSSAEEAEGLSKSDQLETQEKLIHALEQKLEKRNSSRMAPGEDKFIVKEIEELSKKKTESVRLRELFNEKRVRAIKKRKASDYHMWRKEAVREIKKVKKDAERDQTIEQMMKRKSETKMKKRDEDQVSEMGSAVSWALRSLKENGDWG